MESKKTSFEDLVKIMVRHDLDFVEKDHMLKIKVINMNKDSKIYVAGHRGLVGSAIVRNLEREDIQILFVELIKS